MALSRKGLPRELRRLYDWIDDEEREVPMNRSGLPREYRRIYDMMDAGITVPMNRSGLPAHMRLLYDQIDNEDIAFAVPE